MCACADSTDSVQSWICRQYWCFLLSSMLTFLSGISMVLLSRLLTFFISSDKVNQGEYVADISVLKKAHKFSYRIPTVTVNKMLRAILYSPIAPTGVGQTYCMYCMTQETLMPFCKKCCFLYGKY